MKKDKEVSFFFEDGIEDVDSFLKKEEILPFTHRDYKEKVISSGELSPEQKFFLVNSIRWISIRNDHFSSVYFYNVDDYIFFLKIGPYSKDSVLYAAEYKYSNEQSIKLWEFILKNKISEDYVPLSAYKNHLKLQLFISNGIVKRDKFLIENILKYGSFETLIAYKNLFKEVYKENRIIIKNLLEEFAFMSGERELLIKEKILPLAAFEKDKDFISKMRREKRKRCEGDSG